MRFNAAQDFVVMNTWMFREAGIDDADNTHADLVQVLLLLYYSQA